MYNRYYTKAQAVNRISTKLPTVAGPKYPLENDPSALIEMNDCVMMGSENHQGRNGEAA